ncbi:hypothetical protein BKA70DRAFT_1562277 [Coprinopsis sp. MPI-PUGE-AT-0042]|nr:hypothetical protein BKA70DRAFT_1562277 [Coprinopsis sp. MPI-PUGE-AT-0042]
MRLTIAITVVLTQAIALVAAQGCRPVCCHALTAPLRPGPPIGIRCSPGQGEECDYKGQVGSCCQRIIPDEPGSVVGTGIACNFLQF